MTDEAVLIEASRCGDAEAFRTIVERYKGGVIGVAMSRVHDFDDAEDVAQLTFVEAYQRLGSLKEDVKLGVWLRSIAHNRSVDLVRSRRRAAEVAGAWEPPAKVRTPLEDLEQADERVRVWAALGRLKKPQRETVILHYLSGYTLEEVASMLDVPVGTVKYRLHEARARLKKVTFSQVEGVMKHQPGFQDFSNKVFELLRLYPERGRMYDPAVGEPLKQVDPGSTKEGFQRAMELPHWRTRRAAVHYLRLKITHLRMPLDEVLQVVRQGLKDTNRSVRMGAVMALSPYGSMNIPKEQWEREMIPLVFPLLFDHSAKVRHRVAGFLTRCAAHLVPLETVVQAMARETETENLLRMQHLLRAVLEIRKQE